MNTFLRIALGALLFLSACTDESRQLAPDGKPLPKFYRIGPSDEGRIQYRMLDAINALRSAANAQPLVFNSQLNAVAKTHSRDMSIQNRPWHFGSDGSSPLDRVSRIGYPGNLIGENISETYETELKVLAAWMEEDGTRAVILNPNAVNMGFAWFQEPNGKLWWTLVTGS
jgi:uncharacterized protein YkwD